MHIYYISINMYIINVNLLNFLYYAWWRMTTFKIKDFKKLITGSVLSIFASWTFVYIYIYMAAVIFSRDSYTFIDASLSVHHLNASLYFSSLPGTLKPIIYCLSREPGETMDTKEQWRGRKILFTNPFIKECFRNKMLHGTYLFISLIIEISRLLHDQECASANCSNELY